MSVDTTTPIQIGEVWVFDPDPRAPHRLAPAGTGVTGWASVALEDGTREVFYGLPYSRGELYTYFEGGSGEQDILFDHSWPQVVAIAVPEPEIRRFISRASGPPEKVYISYDWTTLSLEPVNQAPNFFKWRDILSRHALELRQHNPAAKVYTDRVLHRIEHINYELSDENRRRAGNLSQKGRSVMGWLWRLLHDYSAVPVTDTATWTQLGEELAAYLDLWCGMCAGEDWPGRVDEEHPVESWETLTRGKVRFLPEPDLSPRILPEPIITDAVMSTDILNFNAAVSWRRKPVEDTWPAVESLSYPVPDSPTVPIQNAPYAAEKQVAAAHWRLQWDAIAATSLPAAVKRHYQAYILQNLLASVRDRNWQSEAARQILRRNRDFTVDFVTRARADLATAYRSVPWFVSIFQGWMIGGLGSPLLSDVLIAVVHLPPEEKASDGGWLPEPRARWSALLSAILDEPVP